MTTAGRALRLAAGGALAWSVVAAASAPQFPILCKIAALLVLAAALYRPRWGLVAMTGLAPAGALLAAAPARAAELFAWSLLAGWLLAIWRPLAPAGWPKPVMLPLAVYAFALTASWLSLTIGGAAGVLPAVLPQFVLNALPANHLVLTSPEPETWTLLQTLGGLAVFCAAAGITRSDSQSLRSVAWALVISMSVLAAATLLAVLRGSAEGFERFSLPLADVNAAGSLYVLAAVVALAFAWLRPSPRPFAAASFAFLAAALWLTGSRSAYLALAAGAGMVAAVRHGWQPGRGGLVLGATLLAAGVLVAGVLMAPQSDVEGSAGQSVNLRSQFLVTTARMIASEPVYGVGVGRYFSRSAEFMTSELRALYGNENAHNYFAQQLAELGVAGGLIFLWLAGSILWGGWRAVRQSPADTALHALYAGTTAYVLTCVTGHPLLVPEAALPFWAAFGALAAASSGTGTAAAGPWRALAAAAAIVILAAGVGRAAAAYARPAGPPPEQGFHEVETTRDGARFRWMTRHAVTYIPDGPGFLRLRLRAPGWPAPHPVILETSIGGRLVDRREVPPDESTTWDVPARATGRVGFRRVDFRVNQEWFEEVALGRRAARRPVSLMVERIEWMPLR